MVGWKDNKTMKKQMDGWIGKNIYEKNRWMV